MAFFENFNIEFRKVCFCLDLRAGCIALGLLCIVLRAAYYINITFFLHYLSHDPEDNWFITVFSDLTIYGEY